MLISPKKKIQGVFASLKEDFKEHGTKAENISERS